MTTVRGLFVLAILAALLGAPPTTSAAGNVLHAPVVEPETGTPATVFRLRVSYDGRFEATAVEAVVAGLALPMRLVSGSASHGTWETSVSLPVGSWPVEFRAAAVRGNQPSLAGAALTVLGPTPSPPPSPVPTTIGGGEQPGRHAPQREEVDGQQPQPAVSTTPDPRPAEEPSASDPGDGSPDEPASGGSAGGPTADDDPKPDDRDAGDVDDGGRIGQPEATSEPSADAHPDDRGTGAGNAAGDVVRGGAGDGAADGRPRADTDGGTGSGTEDASPIVDDPALASVRVTAGWAAVLLVLAFVLLGVLGWRRRRDGPEIEETDIAAATEAILRRRAVRRSRVVLPDDPIVRATLGSDEEEPPATRPRR